MPTKTLTIAKEDDVTEADVIAALRELDDRVAELKREMVVRDRAYEVRRQLSRERTARIEKLLAR